AARPADPVPDAAVSGNGHATLAAAASGAGGGGGAPLGGPGAEQLEAAGAGEGRLLIVAGPGTGKTRSLTARIAHVVRDRGVPPERCLAITFTRRAAEELRARLRLLAPQAGPPRPAGAVP